MSNELTGNQLVQLLQSQEILKKLANNEPMGEVGVVRKGDKIILPKGMGYDEAIKWLRRRKEEEERTVAIHEEVDAWPFDGALAFTKALKERFGWTSLIPTPGFFGDHPPQMIGIAVSPTETVQVPWGRVQVPNVDGYLETGIHIKNRQPVFLISGEVKRKHEKTIAEIAKRTRQIVKEESIYRGKAIRLKFPGEHERVTPDHAPKFMDLTNIRADDLIFPQDVQDAVRVSLFNPVEFTEVCRQHEIPLKRGVLLEGPYGTGKTLTANVAAKKCEQNGWTFVYLENVDDLSRAVGFAKRYSPAMIFAEDLDQVLDGQRDSTMNEILNVVDGIDAKGSEVIIALTTNFVEKIDQAMLRPGRLDAVVSVRYPDAEAAARLIRLYGRGLIPEDEDLIPVGLELAGEERERGQGGYKQVTPAVIREVVERSKLAAVGNVGMDGEMLVRADDLIATAKTLEMHLKLLRPKTKDARTPVEQFGDSLGKSLAQRLKNFNEEDVDIRAPETASASAT